jgi:hypothetical protein
MKMGRWWLYKWHWLTYGILGFLVLFSGVASGNVVAMAFGAVFLFAATSAFLTGYVEGEHGVKDSLRWFSP